MKKKEIKVIKTVDSIQHRIPAKNFFKRKKINLKKLEGGEICAKHFKFNNDFEEEIKKVENNIINKIKKYGRKTISAIRRYIQNNRRV